MKISFFDGAMGSMLQKSGLKSGELPESLNLTHPEKIAQIHKLYAKAGAEYITTNTFGANRLKFDNVKEIIESAVALAKKAQRKVALDIGPTGKLLKPMGELDFEDAVSIFAEEINAGKNGSDVVIIETMSDTYELKAAVLATKENCDLPVIASMIFDENSRLLTGADIKTCVTMLEGLGVDVIGVNCGFGAKQFISLVKELRKYTSLPILAQPNAGLPESINGTTVYNVSPKEFALDMKEIAHLGVSYLGGCCGTTPEHISEMVKLCADIDASVPEKKNGTFLCSYSKATEIGKEPIIIGERINPTGKKKIKEALKNNNIDILIKEAVAQQNAGAQVLDVNVGMPEIDEVEMLSKAIYSVQSVTDLPLQIDTANTIALGKALRIYNGKALLNSVNGKEKNMREVFPLAKKYGAVIVCLLLDENGIPQTAKGRIEIAKRIISTASEYGISENNLIFDALTMTVSTDKSNALTTIETLRELRSMGLHTVLGVSNISFGLPKRDAINTAFFTMALENGLSAGIINPLSADMMNAYFSFCALSGFDEGCKNYIASVTDFKALPKSADIDLSTAIINGLKDESALKAKEMLQTLPPLEIINKYIVPALDTVGQKFESKEMFLPQLLMSADSAKVAFDEIKGSIKADKNSEDSKDTIVIATVEGDIHDIGKNIVKVLLENYGFNVYDLGKDVKCEKVLEEVINSNAKLVGLSALMTTTVPNMAKTIELIHSKTTAKVFVGGAVLTPSYAKQISADFYTRDAMASVNVAKEFFKK